MLFFCLGTGKCGHECKNEHPISGLTSRDKVDFKCRIEVTYVITGHEITLHLFKDSYWVFLYLVNSDQVDKSPKIHEITPQ